VVRSDIEERKFTQAHDLRLVSEYDESDIVFGETGLDELGQRPVPLLWAGVIRSSPYRINAMTDVEHEHGGASRSMLRLIDFEVFLLQLEIVDANPVSWRW